jgi:hypothetical protein
MISRCSGSLIRAAHRASSGSRPDSPDDTMDIASTSEANSYPRVTPTNRIPGSDSPATAIAGTRLTRKERATQSQLRAAIH